MFDQKKYIKDYNKENYKMYQFRVRKDNFGVVNCLNHANNKNEYIVNLIEQDLGKRDILTIKQIKDAIIPVLNSFGITEIYLFGSYARGEATSKSDVDIYCDKGNTKSLLDDVQITEKLKAALKKDVDLVFIGSSMHEYFRKEMSKDLIKLC